MGLVFCPSSSRYSGNSIGCMNDDDLHVENVFFSHSHRTAFNNMDGKKTIFLQDFLEFDLIFCLNLGKYESIRS